MLIVASNVAKAQISETQAEQIACTEGHYADSFGWPVLGSTYDDIDPSQFLQMLGWLIPNRIMEVRNGVGNYYPTHLMLTILFIQAKILEGRMEMH